MSVHVLPDVESICVQYLKADPVIAVPTGGRIAGEMNPKSARPCISLFVTGGRSPIEWRVTSPSVQVDVWGETRQETRELALATNASLIAMTGNIQDLGIVANVRTLIVPRPIPDPDDARPHYVFEVSVTVHPIP